MFKEYPSRIALKWNNTVITIKRNETLHCTNNEKLKIYKCKYMVVVPKRLNSLCSISMTQYMTMTYLQHYLFYVYVLYSLTNYCIVVLC